MGWGRDFFSKVGSKPKSHNALNVRNTYIYQVSLRYEQWKFEKKIGENVSGEAATGGEGERTLEAKKRHFQSPVVFKLKRNWACRLL